MIDLTTIDPDTITARGQYATIRAAHEDAKKRLAVLCGQFASVPSQVLRIMQPDGDGAPSMETVSDLLATGRQLLGTITETVGEIEALALQRAALKDAAWGRK